MDRKTQKWCLHADTQLWLENILTDPWITVYKAGSLDSQENEDRFIWSFLIRKDSIKEELQNYTFNQFDGYPCTDECKNSEAPTYYSRFGHDDREPLFFRRRFIGRAGYLELSQEFIHFFQLYYDRPNTQYLLINPDGSEEPVIKIIDNSEIRILLFRLRQFLAFKNMNLMMCVSIRRFFNDPIGENYFPTNAKQVLVYQTNDTHYAIWYQDYSARTKYFSELIGKKVVPDMPVEQSGLFPFEEAQQYESFIIGQDEYGRPIYHTCDPEQLSDYYGKNPGRSHYLTPVFFRKDVLVKYYSAPEKYKVEDGAIYIGDYILRADTNNQDFIIVFLGDLGRDISFTEQQYWKAFNVLPSGEISDTAYRRDFLGEFTDPTAEQFVFRNKYETLQKQWLNKYGWPFFKTLNQADEYRFTSLRIPLANTQQEFDQQVETLAIVLIDAINKSEFDKLLIGQEPPDRQIQSLELFCKTYKIKGYEGHLEFLHTFYRLRSQGASHRKDSKEYPKIRARFRIDEEGFVNSFRNILNQAILLVDFFISSAKN